jgi:magnesium-transporting ATPase (P-type)
VIACGGKKYNGSNIIREECESGLSFLGFLVFENRIKEETRGAIETLNGA